MIDGLKPYPEYKDSGVAWLGEVPQHWDVRQLGRFGLLTKGNGASKEDEVPEGMPCVRYGDLYTQHRFFIDRSRSCVSPERATAYTPIRCGDVLFAASGETIEEIGKSAVNLMTVPAVCGGDVLRFRPAIPVDTRFMGYACDCPSSVAQKSLMGRGFTVMHIYGSQLKSLSLALPPLREQAAIARFLDHADRRIRRYIRAKQKLIKLLEEQKQAIIHRAVTSGLDPNVRLKPSGVEWLGDVPEHWEVRRLKSLVRRVDQGVSPQAENALAKGDAWGVVKAGCVNHGLFRESQHKRLSPGFAFDARLAVAVGDVLVSRASGSPHLVGSTGRVPSLNYKLILSDKTFRPQFAHDVDPDFMVQAMNSRYYRHQVDQAISGADGLANNLPLSSLRAFIFLIPPVEEQRAVTSLLRDTTEGIRGAAVRAEREITFLREYSARLIADVVTGKLDVREAAARLPDESEETEPLDEVDAEVEDSAGEDLDTSPEKVES